MIVIMINQIISLTKRLISIPSTKDNPKEIKRALELALTQLKEFTVERFESNGSPSALIYLGKTRQEKFKIILNGHLDVVPATAEQFTPKDINGRLYGRGADDMKAATAALILLFKDTVGRLNYPLALQLVTDEEMGGNNGVRHQIDKRVRGDFFITGESTNLDIKNEAKGVIWLKIITGGKAAHGAYLWLGDNALWKLKKILDKIEKEFPVPAKETWKTTINLAKISTSNLTANKVPDYAEALLDIRYISSEAKTISKKIRRLVGDQAKIEFIENEPVHYSDKDDQYIQTLKKITRKNLGREIKIIKGHGASDARHYSRVGIAGVEFGPVGAGLHSDNEWVNLKSLESYYQILKQFLLSYCEV